MVYNRNPCIEASFVCLTSIQALGVDFKHHTGPQWRWYEDTIVEAGDLVQLLSAIDSIQMLWVSLQQTTGPQWPWYETTIVEAGDLVQLLRAMVYNKNPCIEASFVCPTSIQVLGVDFKHHSGPQWPWY